MSETNIRPDRMAAQLLEAIVPHVAFDGWSRASFDLACADLGLRPELARAFVPRGALDLAVAYHHAGDDAMVRELEARDLAAMRFRERIALALRLRLAAISDREAARRASALFALPMHAAEGAQLFWGTADRIWCALGDGSDGVNWYSKRATLAGVYGATFLYWLGDENADRAATAGFIDRRIAEVMRIEEVKARLRDNPVLSRAMVGPLRLIGRIRAPRPKIPDAPGYPAGEQ